MPAPDPPLEEMDVARGLGVSVDTLHRMVEQGMFPPPFPISPRSKGWFPEDISSYLYLRSRGMILGLETTKTKGEQKGSQ